MTTERKKLVRITSPPRDCAVPLAQQPDTQFNGVSLRLNTVQILELATGNGNKASGFGFVSDEGSYGGEPNALVKGGNRSLRQFPTDALHRRSK